MSNSPPTICKQIIFHGRVQGVGFRQKTRNLARSFPVTGYVLNRPDGTVELVACGVPADVQVFVTAVQQKMSGYIREANIADIPAGVNFEDFRIRY